MFHEEKLLATHPRTIFNFCNADARSRELAAWFVTHGRHVDLTKPGAAKSVAEVPSLSLHAVFSCREFHANVSLRF